MVALLLLVLGAGLPAVLLWSSWSALRMQQEQKRIYLQSRIGAIAGRLEGMPRTDPELIFDLLVQEEPALAGLRIHVKRIPGDRLDALWDGRQLFLIEDIESPQGRMLRGWAPFHQEGELRIAQIDVWADSADFILFPAQRNLAVSAAASVALALLSLLLWRAFLVRQRALLLQSELEHLAQLGRMAAVLAHEIRNPLGTIKGFAQLIEEQLPDSQRPLVSPIVGEAGRLERLVNDLLAYGRPRQPVVSRVALRPLLEQAVELQRRSAGQADILWQLECIPPEAEIETDPDFLQQILANLLRNAAEAAADGGRPAVTVIARAAGRSVLIEVRDNGPGFTQEALQRGFEPFFTTKSAGTGLGLAISRRLAQSLGGTLEAGNEPEGGAVVRLRLPRKTAGAATNHSLHS